MEFGKEKYPPLVFKSGKKTNNKRNRTTKSKRIRTPEEKENYEYLGIMDADTIKQAEMKEIKKEKTVS